jgi:hypothetical protein
MLLFITIMIERKTILPVIPNSMIILLKRRGGGELISRDVKNMQKAIETRKLP